MPDPQLHQDLGELRGRLGALEERMSGLEKDIDQRLERMEREFKGDFEKLTGLLQEVRDNQTAVKGGWKAITIFFGAIASVSAGISWIIDHFRG